MDEMDEELELRDLFRPVCPARPEEGWKETKRLMEEGRKIVPISRPKYPGGIKPLKMREIELGIIPGRYCPRCGFAYFIHDDDGGCPVAIEEE